MRRLAGIAAVGTLLALPAPAAAKGGCPVRDARSMLAAAGQGLNGRVLAVHDEWISVEAESRYARGIAFGEVVRIHGTSLPAGLQGRIGIVVRRRGGRWTAGRCDVIPAWRMANALAGLTPCPAPGVRITAVRVEGLVAHVTLRLIGDVTTLRIDSGRAVRRRHFAEPGFQMIVEDLVYPTPGTFRVEVRAEGGSGPGCGTARRRSSFTTRSVVVG